MTDRPAENHEADEEPKEASKNEPTNEALKDGVRRQRQHIIDLTGQDPLASRDD